MRVYFFFDKLIGEKSTSKFLKKILDKPYLISLQLRCSYYKSYNVQVNVEGNKGTVKFQMRQYCTPSYNWGHDAFSDKDIGDLQQVHFMVSIHVPTSSCTSSTRTISLHLLESFLSQFVSIIIVQCTSKLNDAADITHIG